MLDDCVIWTVHNLRRKSQNNALIFKTMTIDIQVISLLIDLVVLFLLLMNFEALTFSGTNPFDIRIIGYYFHLSLYFRMRWDHIRRFTLRSNKDFPGFKEFFMGGRPDQIPQIRLPLRILPGLAVNQHGYEEAIESNRKKLITFFVPSLFATAPI